MVCKYFYRPNSVDHGVLKLRELAQFALVCRRCEEPSCVKACKFEALERQEDGTLTRHNLRCVSCGCCMHACPFGTIYPETVPFYVTNCDYCMNADADEPACIASCEKAALSCRNVTKDDEQEGIHIVNKHLAVKVPKWIKEDT